MNSRNILDGSLRCIGSCRAYNCLLQVGFEGLTFNCLSLQHNLIRGDNGGGYIETETVVGPSAGTDLMHHTQNVYIVKWY